MVPISTPADGAERVEGLREVQPSLGGPRVAQHGDERVRPGLQESQPAGDHEQSEQEEAVMPHHGRGPEQKCAGAVEQQAGHQPRLVAVLPHDQRRRHGQQEVPHVEGRLEQSRLEAAHLERLHELLDQDVVQVVGDTPEEEQRRHQDEGQRVAGGEQLGLSTGCGFSGHVLLVFPSEHLRDLLLQLLDRFGLVLAAHQGRIRCVDDDQPFATHHRDQVSRVARSH